MSKIFLTAEWQKLAMVNYAIDPKILQPYLPAHTEVDFWNGTCYASLVGFMFLKTKLKGVSVPFHTNFPEVNLRFYVRYNHEGDWRRGVVFVKEIVPMPALTLVANMVYGEKYETMKMKHEIVRSPTSLDVTYQWMKDRWHKLSVSTEIRSTPILKGSEEEFITEHYWGYTKLSDTSTSAYQVEHPRWEIYPLRSYQVDVDFGRLYGDRFDFLRNEKPTSVFLAEGSPVSVRSGRRIS